MFTKTKTPPEMASLEGSAISNSSFVKAKALHSNLTQISPSCQGSTQLVEPHQLKGLWGGKRVVRTDAEWGNVIEGVFHKSKYISSQFAWRYEGREVGLFILHPDFPFESVELPELDTLMILRADPNKVNPYNLGMLTPDSDIALLMFYSPKDVQATVGADIWHHVLQNEKTQSQNYNLLDIKGTVSKKRKLNGYIEGKSIGKIKLYDVQGTTTAGMTLDGFHESVGIESPYKKLADDWDKSKMEDFANGHPANFLRYAMGDVMFLEQAMYKRTDQVNQMILDSLGFDPGYIVPWEKPGDGEARFPMSSGSLVSNTFEKWLEQDEFYRECLLHLAPYTQYTSTKGHREFHKTWVTPYLENPTTKSGKYDPAHPLTKLPDRLSYHTDDRLDHYHPLSYNSIPGMIHLHKGGNSTGLLGAIVYGGRCVNEYPTNFTIQKAMDVDLQSCYGSALTNFILPLGFSKTLKYAANNLNRMTLKQFLTKHCGELVDNLYSIVVDGKLDFSQDLLASKLDVDEIAILRATLDEKEDCADDGGRDVDKSHLPGHMVHLTKELRNTVITSDLLKVLRKVCTEKELKSFMGVTVQTATWYPRQWQVTTLDELETVLSQHPPNQFESDNVTPKLPPVWVSVPLEGFVGNLVRQRKIYKGMKEDPQYDLLQNGMKLFINTTYGCFASPYFRMGSAILANNITAKARLGAWMMGKALALVQTITDGGLYSYSAVRYLNPSKFQGKCPGMGAMSNYEALNNHRSITVAPLNLPGLPTDFQEMKAVIHNDKKIQEELDRLVTEHINRFWGHYDLELPFKIEHKYEHTGDAASYNGSANYLIVGTKPDKKGRNEVFKARGCKDAPNGDRHKKYLHLKALLENDPGILFPQGNIQQYSILNKILQVGAYQQNPAKYDAVGVLPGDSEDQTQTFRPSLNAVLVATEQEYRSRQDAHQKAVRRHDKDLALNPLGPQFGYTTKHTSTPSTLKIQFPQLS